MSSLPLVSIITITLNRAHLIYRAIESIQKQTYPNYEHIIVDGNSSDNTREVVENYARTDSRIKYIRLSEKGAAVQIKTGFDSSKGKYITFLDDDDEYLPTKLEKQIALFETLSEEYGLVYCWMSYFDNQTKKYLYIHKTELKGDVSTQVVETPRVSGTPTLMFRRSVLGEFGGTTRDDIGLPMSDWELAARVCQYYKVDYVAESLVNVYINHGHERMSEFKRDEGYQRQLLLFSRHFLSEFKPIFDKYPRKSRVHLYIAAKSCFLLGRWREGFSYYWPLLRYKPSIKSLLLIPCCWYKRK